MTNQRKNSFNFKKNANIFIFIGEELEIKYVVILILLFII